MKKNVLITIFSLCLIKLSYSQTNTIYSNLKFLKGELSGYLTGFFSKNNHSQFDTLCIKSCSFISFTVNQDSTVDSIYCNKGTPAPLARLFIQAIYSTKGNWAIIDPLKKNKQRFILPVCYQFYVKNCVINNESFESIMTILDFSGKNKIENIPFLPNNVPLVDCILLEPIYFGSSIH